MKPRPHFAILLSIAMVLATSSRFPTVGRQAAAPSPKGVDQKLANQFPEGEGKEIVLSACVQCHGLGEIASQRIDTKEWQKVIHDMVARGSQLLPGESETLVQYLATNFGPLLNVNTATATELASLPSVDKTLAEAIVRYRDKNGPFKEIREMAKVEGVTPQILEKIKDRIAMGLPADPEKKKK